MGSTKTNSYLFMLRLQICTVTPSYPEDAIIQLPLWSILISIFPEYFSTLRLRCGTKKKKIKYKWTGYSPAHKNPHLLKVQDVPLFATVVSN